MIRNSPGRVAAAALFMLLAALTSTTAFEARGDAIHVFPGENIQEAIEAAAKNPTNKVVKVHAGEYRPRSKRPAFIWFNHAHDGVVVEAVGRVVLTAANPDISRPASRSHPAVVNHVVYFGHGISSNTVLRGFRITGANGYVTDKFVDQMEPDRTVPRNSFFMTDGGAIKIFGKSSPTLEDLEIVDNYTSPCGGGVSVQQQGLKEAPVLFRNCIFKGNRAQVTGCALDLLEGSAAIVQNCLFVGNTGNTGVDIVAKASGEKPFTNSGVLTVFQNSSVHLERCTFVGNRNGVDDLGGESTYSRCLFYNNTKGGSPLGGSRYDLDLQKGGVVQDCYFGGAVLDPFHAVAPARNSLNAPDPRLDAAWKPANPACEDIGYRPGVAKGR